MYIGGRRILTCIRYEQQINFPFIFVLNASICHFKFIEISQLHIFGVSYTALPRPRAARQSTTMRCLVASLSIQCGDMIYRHLPWKRLSPHAFEKDGLIDLFGEPNLQLKVLSWPIRGLWYWIRVWIDVALIAGHQVNDVPWATTG